MRRASICRAASTRLRCRCTRWRAGADKWNRSTEYVKGAIEHFSQWYPYPWPAAINLGGYGAGMEYPGIVFDGFEDGGKDLFWITAHEIGHTWFPMIVGSNERRHAFMDEGFNTFIDVYASDAFNQGEYAPKRDSNTRPKAATRSTKYCRCWPTPVRRR